MIPVVVSFLILVVLLIGMLLSLLTPEVLCPMFLNALVESFMILVCPVVVPVNLLIPCKIINISILMTHFIIAPAMLTTTFLNFGILTIICRIAVAQWCTLITTDIALQWTMGTHVNIDSLHVVIMMIMAMGFHNTTEVIIMIARPMEEDIMVKAQVLSNLADSPPNPHIPLYPHKRSSQHLHRVLLTSQMVLPNLADGPLDLANEQDRTGQDRTGQLRTTQDRAGQLRTGQDNSGQDRTTQNRTGQDRITQDRTGQLRTGQDRPGQDRTGQLRIGQDRAGQDSLGQLRTTQDNSGQLRTGQDRTGQDNTGQLRTGQDNSGQLRTTQNRTGQDRTGQDNSGQLRTTQDSLGQDRTGQDNSEQDRTGQDRTGQDNSEQDRTGQDRTGQDNTGQLRTGRDNSGQLRTTQDNSGQLRTA
ncbi:uncharacterized protein HD556DRAFT_1312926 [Suillus plorans]|uniref:Uncharacterized protein n=1 Tax=Suillus plorans TaxID=116603 RepID=A0A9P7DBF0_9AGAM|nr:uncharacterized protein HD556DRAFT_1312926 [Suillus plorans]KAG1787210.1 hypothetical protein HD556DRAFT_1312926 [Suillus plorans]